MTDKQTLAAFMRGETLDDAQSRQLWKLGWVTVVDVTEHNAEGRREVMAIKLTSTGRAVWDGMLADAKLIDSAKKPTPENQNVMDYSMYVD